MERALHKQEKKKFVVSINSVEKFFGKLFGKGMFTGPNNALLNTLS